MFKAIHLRRSKLIVGLTLAFSLMSCTSVFAAIPAGTVIFGNGQALDLGYVNNPDNLAEVRQDLISGGSIYVKSFSGRVIDNITNDIVTDTSILPAVTYKDAKGVIKHFAKGDGAETGESVSFSVISIE